VLPPARARDLLVRDLRDACGCGLPKVSRGSSNAMSQAERLLRALRNSNARCEGVDEPLDPGEQKRA